MDCFACMDPGGGELCFISNKSKNMRVKCDPFGNISTSPNWLGWEVWRFIETCDGDGSIVITSWTHNTKVLCSNSNGEVFTTANKDGDWEKWIVEKKSNQGVLIRSLAHNRVLWTDGECLRTEDNDHDGACVWCLEYANTFYISSKAADKRLGCTRDDHAYTTTNRKGWEEWKIEFIRPGCVTIISYAHNNGEPRYLTESPDGKLLMCHHPYEWLIKSSPRGGVTFSSCASGKLLVCPTNEAFTVSIVDCTDETIADLMLETRMPISISLGQIAGLTLAGTFGILSVGLAPMAVMGVVGALGFEAGGIAAGSAAAGMMSAEAIAAGGGVAAGGVVATFQSIGAAGLGVAGTTAAATGGALVGGTAVGLTGASVLASDNNAGNYTSGISGLCRPFAGWRHW